MLTLPEKLLFILAVIASLGLAASTFRRAFRTIRRGEGKLYFDKLPERMIRALDVLVTQRTVFRARRLTSLFHGFVVWGFLYYALINLVDVTRGFVDYTFLGHDLPGDIYRLLGDVLSVLVIVGMIYFVIRRFGTKDPALTFHANIKLHEKVQSGIRRDSLIVASFILIHVGGRFIGESFSAARFGADAQPFAGLIGNLWDGVGAGTLEFFEHIFWWLGFGTILAFIPYFPYTKHAHLFMGPLNYFSRPDRRSLGELPPLDFEDEAREQFGAAKIEHLSQKQIFDAYACIMCNRCQDVCPAYVTGKELSPSALEVNKRYELRQIMPSFAKGDDSPRPLLDFAITEPAVWACTACGACVDICPVGNEPMFDIMDIRRDLVLTQSNFPSALQGAFNGMEKRGNPWQMAQNRMAWAVGLEVPTVDESPDYEILYWVGCAGAFEPSAQKIARTLVQVLQHAGVKFAVLGDAESCTGDTARRAGNEYLFFEMAKANIETLNAAKPPRILVTCPHCYHTIAKEYPQFGGNYEVVHHTAYLNELIQAGRLKPQTASANVTFHDPCYLGRHNGIVEAPRDTLTATGATLTEMDRTREKSFCCGAGGAQFWKEEEHGSARVNLTRYAEAKATGAETLATGCPFCLRMFTDAGQDESIQGGPAVKDVVEIVAERLGLSG